MDTSAAHALIDTCTLEDCAALLAACAPDLLAHLRAAAKSGCDSASLLSLARDLVKRAYARENLQ